MFPTVAVEYTMRMQKGDENLFKVVIVFLTNFGACIRRTCFILASSRRVWSSLRRSFLLPTRMMGTLGQKCFTSGVHFSGMFSVWEGGERGGYRRLKWTSATDCSAALLLRFCVGRPFLISSPEMRSARSRCISSANIYNQTIYNQKSANNPTG